MKKKLCKQLRLHEWFHDFEIEQKLSKTFCFLHINMTTPENEITTEHTFFFIPEQYFVWTLTISYRYLLDFCLVLSSYSTRAFCTWEKTLGNDFSTEFTKTGCNILVT